MNVEQLNQLLDRISVASWYRSLDWEVQDFPVLVVTPGEEWPFARFRITYMEPDTETGQMERQHARWWYVEPSMDEEAIIKSAWAALTMSDEHRRREGFRVDNALIFNPHTRIIQRMPRNESVSMPRRIHEYPVLGPVDIDAHSWRKLYEGDWPEIEDENPAKVGE